MTEGAPARTAPSGPADEALAEAFATFAATRDPKLREELIEHHLWLARHAARRFGRRGVENDDLVQVASYALVKALDRYDPATGFKFSTFAMPTMIGEIRRHFRDKTWAMRVPRRLKELHLQLRSATSELTATLGRKPTVEELATEIGATAEEILEALEAGEGYRIDTLDRSTENDGDRPGDPGGDDPALELTSDRASLHEALGSLKERDRRVVYLRYYLDMTQSEIADAVGVSQVHVSRILRAALSQLRGELDDEEPAPPSED